MKQKFLIVFGLILLIVILVGLNAASYSQKQTAPDSEVRPNRSTYNPGATGTQAFYTLLSETGHKVTHWQEPPSALLTDKKNVPAVFVVVGSIRREFTPPEIEELLRWVANGGKLVLIDRAPPKELTTTTANWRLTFQERGEFAVYGIDPSDQKQMTADTPALKPAQPTIFASGVNAVQPSRFASSVAFERFSDSEKAENGERLPPPKRTSIRPIKAEHVEASSPTAPAVHVGAGERNLLVDAPYGSGKIVFLSDPYIVSNAGIGIVDNAQLGINVVSTDGMIVFDEYHQGFGSSNNRFLQFFEGTPVVAIFLQGIVLLGFVFFSQSRRFARAVPESEPDRLSKLEYVSAMAELQQRTRAFDLAIENIYTDFRRRAARFLGVDNYTTKRAEMAKFIAERAGLDQGNIDDLMFKCEDIIHGEPTNKRQVLELSGALRRLEDKLGMTRAAKTRIR